MINADYASLNDIRLARPLEIFTTNEHEYTRIILRPGVVSELSRPKLMGLCSQANNNGHEWRGECVTLVGSGYYSARWLTGAMHDNRLLNADRFFISRKSAKAAKNSRADDKSKAAKHGRSRCASRYRPQRYFASKI